MLDQGIHFDVDDTVYHLDPAPQPSLNQTTAKILIEKSPAHAYWQHPRLNKVDVKPSEYDKDIAIGNAAHALILGRGATLDVANFKDWRTNEAKRLRQDSFESGCQPILIDHYTMARSVAFMVRSQLSKHQCSEVFTEGNGEVVLIWEEDGIWFRTMIDWLSKDMLRSEDLKTTSGSVAPHAVPWLMDDWGWEVQAAMHERGLNKLDPDNIGRRVFRFVAVENHPPHCLTVSQMDEAQMTLGRRKLQLAVDIWRKCMMEKRWPGYTMKRIFPSTPGNRFCQWEERESQIREEMGL